MTKLFYPGLLDQDTKVKATQLGCWPMVWSEHSRSKALIKVHPRLSVCAVTDSGKIFLAHPNGFPSVYVGRATSRRRNKEGNRADTYAINMVSTAHRPTFNEVVNISTVSGALSHYGRFNSPPAYNAKPQMIAPTILCNLVGLYIRDTQNRTNMFEADPWKLTEEQQRTLMAVYLNKINKSEVPDTMTAAITNAWDTMQRQSHGKISADKLISDLFSRDKWLIVWLPEPYRYYVVGKVNCHWLYRYTNIRASNNYASPPEVDIQTEAYKSLSALPDDIRDDVNGAVAMYNMGMGNRSTVDPHKIIPQGFQVNHDLGAISYGSLVSNEYSLILLDC